MSGLDHFLFITEVAVLLANDDDIVLSWCWLSLSSSNDNTSLTRDQRITSESFLAATDWTMVPDLAVGILTTGANTGILAVVVKTSQSVGALTIILTISLATGDERIALVSSGTPTGGSIAGGNTVSVGTAGVGVAGVGLLLAASDGVWGWDIAWDTLAHGVAKSVDIALSVGSTRTGEAGIWRRGSDLNLATASDGIRLRLVSRQTGTDGVALTVGLALCVGSTGAGVTGIWLGSAPVVVTDVAGATVGVNLTLSSTPRDGVRHGDISWQASAHWVTLSVLHALSVGATRRWLTRVWTWDTSLGLTHVPCVTVWVTCTLRSTASDGIRFGDQTRLTSADGVSSEVNCTDSTRSTGRWIARIRFLNTFLILADVTTLAVGVNDTFRFTSGDGIRVGDETRLTSADGIT